VQAGRQPGEIGQQQQSQHPRQPIAPVAQAGQSNKEKRKSYPAQHSDDDPPGNSRQRRMAVEEAQAVEHF